MKLLLDTQVLLWAASGSPRLPAAAESLILDSNSLIFSAASIWEVVIKHMLGRADFRADPAALRSRLLANGYAEIAVASPHALAVSELPAIHKDPFDRILVAQAIVENATLVTADETISRYPAPVMLV